MRSRTSTWHRDGMRRLGSWGRRWLWFAEVNGQSQRAVCGKFCFPKMATRTPRTQHPLLQGAMWFCHSSHREERSTHPAPWIQMGWWLVHSQQIAAEIKLCGFQAQVMKGNAASHLVLRSSPWWRLQQPGKQSNCPEAAVLWWGSNSSHEKTSEEAWGYGKSRSRLHHPDVPAPAITWLQPHERPPRQNCLAELVLNFWPRNLCDIISH